MLSCRCAVSGNMLIWQGYVDQLIQTARSEDGGINDIGTIGSSNDKFL